MVSLKLGNKMWIVCLFESHWVTAIFSQILIPFSPTYNFMLHLLLIVNWRKDWNKDTCQTFKKESDVEMLLTDISYIQSTETSYMYSVQ